MNQNSPLARLASDSEIQPYELFMLLLCIYSLITLAVETFVGIPQDDLVIFDAIDNLVCGVFLFDFLVRFTYAPSKLKFLSWGWIDLLSSIPAIDIFRAGRIVRVVRILRVLRGIRMARILAKYLQNNRADGAIIAVVFVSILLLLISSVAILQVEKPAIDANIKTGPDALWWAIVTMTTVGYGDKFPVTTIGRIIAGFLMVGGVGLFGTLSGSVTSWILSPVEVRQEVDLNQIQKELSAIHARLDEVNGVLQQKIDPQLQKLINTWPDLSLHRRQQLARLIESHLNRD